MVDAAIWFLSIEILGLLALPLSFVLFHRLPDRGYTLAKPLALILGSYSLWLLGLSHIAPNTRATIFGILVLGGLIAVLLIWRNRDSLLAFLKREWPGLLAAEGIFLGFFIFWAFIVSEVPAISHTEKPMDFAFLNAVLQSRFFPVEDPWLAGQSISYYYFGHFTMAFLTHLTGITSSIAYNLSVSLVPAMAAMGAFGLVNNLIRLSGGSRLTALGFGLIAPALLLLAGNLEGALEFIHAQGWGGDGFWAWIGVKGLEAGAAGSSAFPNDFWWWWRATRVIDTLQAGLSLDYTITEFPFFSFILGDLHPHVVSLPFVILGLSLCLNLFLSPARFGPAWLWRHPIESAAIALLIGSLAFINAWDFPLLAVLLSMVLLLKAYGQNDGDLSKATARSALMLLPILSVAVVLFLPFYLTLASQVSGILPLTGVSTRPISFFLVMGLFFFLGVSFLLRQVGGLSMPARREAPGVLLILVVSLMPLAVWIPIVYLITAISDGAAAAITKVLTRTLWVLPGLAFVALAGGSAAQRVLLKRDLVVAFPLLLLAAAFFLLVGVELFFVADAFGNRMNTVFKVYYQTWLLLAIIGAYGLYFWYSHGRVAAQAGTTKQRRAIPVAIRRALRPGRLAWTGVLVLLLTASAYYPVGAVLNRTGITSPNHTFSDNTLNGLAYVADADQGEYAAIQWLRDEAPWGRIVEAVGDDYSEYGRISGSTGLPTVLGWKGHEIQWRGNTRLLDGREEDITQIFQSDDPRLVGRLLKKYDVTYVYLGRREKSAYGGLRLPDLDGLLETVFDQDGVVIYKVVSGALGENKGDSG